MKLKISITLIIVFIGLSANLGASDKVSKNKIKRVILLKDEQSLNVKVVFGAGTINILPAGGDTLLEALMYYFDSDAEPEINYYIQGDKGYLEISSSPSNNSKDKEDTNININSFDELKKNVWNIRVSQKVVIKMQVEMGAAKSDFDFGKMKLSGLTIECGASDSRINFSEENPIEMKKLTLKAGVSKIRGKNFLNANFKKFVFNGGVGIYHFNMGGELRQKADIDMNLGGASATIELNEQTPFILKVDDSFLSSVRVENAEKKGGRYKSYNYKKDSPFLNINTDIGIGTFELLVGE